VIFKGKLLSTAVSMGLMLTTRILFPNRMKQMDAWLGERVFQPLISEKDLHPVTGDELPSTGVDNPMIKQLETDVSLRQ
jgi:hypothetical protein